MFLTRVFPLKGEHGKIVQWFGTNTDLEDTKQIEMQLRATEAALREADHRKDLFLATLAHELRNPLAPIRTAAQVLADPRLAPSQVRWAQSVIQRQVSHMALLLDDLLDIARITQGKLVLQKTRITLTEVIDAAVEAARPIIDRKHHRPHRVAARRSVDFRGRPVADLPGALQPADERRQIHRSCRPYRARGERRGRDAESFGER